MTAIPCGQKKRRREMIQSQTVTPPLAAIEGTTLRLNTATTKSRTRSRRPRARMRCGCTGWGSGDKLRGRCFYRPQQQQVPHRACRPVRNDKNSLVDGACEAGELPAPHLHHLQCATATGAARSCCAFASDAAMSLNASRCLSISASVCWTEMVHCSSHQYGCAITPRLTMPNQ